MHDFKSSRLIANSAAFYLQVAVPIRFWLTFKQFYPKESPFFSNIAGLPGMLI
jgi:hypothetical protein